jgi:hypothetical protein
MKNWYVRLLVVSVTLVVASSALSGCCGPLRLICI